MVGSLRLQQFRSYKDKSVTLSPAVTIISGPNGSGKTNLLEALYVLARGTSFRASDQELGQIGMDWWRLDARLVANESRSILFEAEKTTGRKTFILDGVKKQRLTYQHKLPVVLFEPGDLRLLHGSPARRRLFIDTLISQLEPLYGPLLSKYDRVLKQRNNLLKHLHSSKDELFVWDVALSEYGARIVAERQKYSALLNASLRERYRAIAHTKDIVSLAYSFQEGAESVQQAMVSALHAHHVRDKALGYTTVGPHRHDLIFSMNDVEATSIASRGETRSIVLALKFIEVEMLRVYRDQPPLLLLDDVFSELDSTRRMALVEVGSSTQTVITTTNADIQKTFGGAPVKHVKLK
ncbi:DNA replication and repair protein RecF [candidate division TM7 genomosp. GTL1]|nr:DNA replication and repair protein RecF [candidate division TM7 genomosp. GTL1]